MQQLFSGRIFADHYQFYLYDNYPAWWAEMPDWIENDHSRKGYICNGRTIYIGTQADSNNHWLEIYSSDRPPSFNQCERAIGLNIEVQSGELVFDTTLGNGVSMRLEPGKYVAYILQFNLGEEEIDSYRLSDEEFFQRTDLERYKIVLVPGTIKDEGVFKGGEYRY